MPSSELAYKTLYTTLDTRTRASTQPGATPAVGTATAHDDVFVETSGPTAATSYMFIVRASQTPQGVFAHVDKRAATAPRVDRIPSDAAAAFLQALPDLTLAAATEEEHITPASGSYELRVRNAHLDVTMHFANPRRRDLVALGEAIRALIVEQLAQ